MEGTKRDAEHPPNERHDTLMGPMIGGKAVHTCPLFKTLEEDFSLFGP
jgi:hypothetical protein